jgi:hypothetical protein
MLLDFDVDHISQRIELHDDEHSDDEHWFSDESDGILLLSYLYVLFYKFLLSVMPVCI